MLWEVVHKYNGEVIVIDNTRRQAYESKHMLEEMFGGKYFVRKLAGQ